MSTESEQPGSASTTSTASLLLALAVSRAVCVLQLADRPPMVVSASTSEPLPELLCASRATQAELLPCSARKSYILRWLWSCEAYAAAHLAAGVRSQRY